MNVEWLSVFAEKSILCQLMPVREMDLVQQKAMNQPPPRATMHALLVQCH